MLPCATCAAGLKVEACRNEAFSCADSDFRGAGGPECGERTWIPNFSTVPHGFRTNLTDPACEEAASPVPPHNPTVKNDQDGPAGRTQPDASSPAAPAQRRKKRVANNLEWKDPASPIPAGLDATDLLVAEILGGIRRLRILPGRNPTRNACFVLLFLPRLTPCLTCAPPQAGNPCPKGVHRPRGRGPPLLLLSVMQAPIFLKVPYPALSAESDPGRLIQFFAPGRESSDPVVSRKQLFCHHQWERGRNPPVPVIHAQA